jgi:hypothetical protein
MSRDARQEREGKEKRFLECHAFENSEAPWRGERLTVARQKRKAEHCAIIILVCGDILFGNSPFVGIEAHLTIE